MIAHISDDQLDAAVDRLLLGEHTADVAASYPAAEDELRPLLYAATMLETARPVETPAIVSLVADRNNFLADLTELQLQPVSPRPIVRLRGWISQQISGFSTTPTQQPKEIRKMSALILKVALLFAIAFGSLGGTLAVTADSLPDSAVYPLKLAMEQAQLTFKTDSVEQAEMHLVLAQVRAQEMARLAAKGAAPEEALLTRMQNHLRTAYQLAAQADDKQMQGLLTQAQEITQNSGQELAAAQEQVQARVQERLQQASGMMFLWQREAESGLQDPGRFRWQYGPGGPCADDDCQPSTGSGEQEQHRYGLGGPPCEGDDCQPPFGSGEQEQHRYGLGGPPCEGDDCQPPFGSGEQEQHQYGPGDPLCEGDDCEPSNGNRNQQQNQNTEQNQGQEDTQNQNQEQNDHGSNGQQSSGNDNSSGSGSSGDSGSASDSGSSGDSGGSGDSGNSGSSGSSGDSDGAGDSGDSSGSGSSNGSGSGRGS